jgi:hypothetical protein
MAYHADPGGIFDSDTHRRTLAHLPLPDDDVAAFYSRYGSVLERLKPDVGTDLADEQEADDVLADLEADGYATQTKDGWKQTKKGLEALNAPVPESE